VFVTASKAKAAAPEKQEGIIFVPANITNYKSTVLGADGKTAIYSIEAYVDGVKQELWLKTNPASSAVTAGYKTSTIDATTGALMLAEYTPTAPAKKLEAQKTISSITTVNGKNYLDLADTITGGKFDATKAVIVDTTGGNVSTLEQIKGLKADGYGFGVKALYTENDTTSVYTVEYIYITEVTEPTP